MSASPKPIVFEVDSRYEHVFPHLSQAVLDSDGSFRIMPSPHAWTNKVAQYLRLFDPHNSGLVEMHSRNATTGEVTPGKVIGPDGNPFFRVDAPHGAPSQHVFVYNTALIVGAGIGVTPCASIMKGIVNYRWKKGFTPNNLHFFWVARLSDLTTFKWLLVMLPELKAQQLVHNEYYGGDEQRRTALMRRAGQRGCDWQPRRCRRMAAWVASGTSLTGSAPGGTSRI